MILAANVMSRSQNEGFKVTGKRAAHWLGIYFCGQLPGSALSSPVALLWPGESRDHVSSAQWENYGLQADIKAFSSPFYKQEKQWF